MASIRDVINFEVTRNLKKKSFWYASLAPPLIILAIIGISTISSNHAKKANQQQAQTATQTSKIAVRDETGLINQQQLAKQHVTIEPSKQAGIADVKDGKVDAFFFYPKNVSKDGISIYAQDQGVKLTPPYDAAATDLLKQAVISRVGVVTGNNQAVQILQKTPAVKDTTYKNGKVTNGLAKVIAPGAFMVAFLALLVLLSYLMISSTTEEKENRAAEIILTSIKARSLILGKILAIFILGLVQLVVILAPLFVYFTVSGSHSLPGGVSLGQVPLDAKAIAFGALFFFFGLSLFIGLLVGMGSMFPNAQDAGRYLGVAMLWAYIPIYTLSYIVSSPHTIIVTVFTYFPLTAPTTAMLRNAVGTISTPEALGALAITIVSASTAIWFAVRSFRYGAMEYGRRLSLKEIIR